MNRPFWSGSSCCRLCGWPFSNPAAHRRTPELDDSVREVSVYWCWIAGRHSIRRLGLLEDLTRLFGGPWHGTAASSASAAGESHTDRPHV